MLEIEKQLDLETDNDELEKELLKAIDGPFTPYSLEEMTAIAKRVSNNFQFPTSSPKRKTEKGNQ